MSHTLESGTWQPLGLALNYTDRPYGIVFRPDVIYNARTGKYVMWANVAIPGIPGGCYFAATADSPAGPFVLAADMIPLAPANRTYRAGDYHLLVDEDDPNGAAYVVYSADKVMAVNRLTDDYLSTTGEFYSPVGPVGVEAPSFFKRNGVFYALTSWCCCFCLQGSGIMVFTATNALGPYTAQPGGDLACVPQNETATMTAQEAEEAALDGFGAIPSPGAGCLFVNQTSVVHSQMNSVAIVPSSTGEVQVVWFGETGGSRRPGPSPSSPRTQSTHSPSTSPARSSSPPPSTSSTTSPSTSTSRPRSPQGRGGRPSSPRPSTPSR
jgi:hypothetical protein